MKDSVQDKGKPLAITCVAVNLTLEGCLEELAILMAILKEVDREPSKGLYRYISPQMRFIITEKERKRLEEEVYELIPYTNVQKLRADIDFVCTTLVETCLELSQTGHFTTVQQVVEDFKREASENEDITSEHQENNAKIVQLRQQLIEDRKSCARQLEAHQKALQELRDHYEEILGDGNQQLSYANKWESSRGDLNRLTLFLKEKVYTDQINTYLSQLDAEERIHSEIHNFIEENVEDLKNGIQYWMERYDDEIEKIESEILKMKMASECLEVDLEQMQCLYDITKAKVDKLLWEKEEKRRQAELLELQIRAAVFIQRWWREVMKVRKLGPYKVKKKKKDKDKKKKGKK